MYEIYNGIMFLVVAQPPKQSPTSPRKIHTARSTGKARVMLLREKTNPPPLTNEPKDLSLALPAGDSAQTKRLRHHRPLSLKTCRLHFQRTSVCLATVVDERDRATV